MIGAFDLIMKTQQEFIRIRAGIERLMLPVAQEYGLTPTQAAVLNLIRGSEEATVSMLFKALDFNQGNMSSMCKKLEADGFITKVKSTDDERKCYLRLTKKATDSLCAINDFFANAENDRWITQEEFAAAENAVETLRTTAAKVNLKLAETLIKQSEDK